MVMIINDVDDDAVCVICFDNPPDSVFMPCGHAGICYECAVDLYKNSESCYLCRKVKFSFLYFIFKENYSIIVI